MTLTAHDLSVIAQTLTQVCDDAIKYPRTCKDIDENGASTSGKYHIVDSANEAFSVLCDMESEPGFVWALIKSYSLANNTV